MTTTQIIDQAGNSQQNNAAVTGAYKVGNFNKGESKMTLSRQWAIRPNDQRYLSLDALLAATKLRHERSHEERVDANKLRLVADRTDDDTLRLMLPTTDETHDLTNWTFGQLCRLGEPAAPASYLSKLPAYITGLNLQFTLMHRGEQVKALVTDLDDDTSQLRAVTGPDYGRIPDYQVVDAVRSIAGDRWKIPGVLDWLTMLYNPHVEPTTESTTLFASDRDVFIFLVDDTHPIVIGKLPSGEDDLIFRGFYVTNSEVGKSSLIIATFYLRGICCNRIMWGVEGFEELSMRHSKFAPRRFVQEAQPALSTYTERSDGVLLNGIKRARELIVAKTDEERIDFLTGRGIAKPQAQSIIETVLREEEHPAESIWDFVQGMSAVARRIQHQDTRIDLEKQTRRLLDKAA